MNNNLDFVSVIIHRYSLRLRRIIVKYSHYSVGFEFRIFATIRPGLWSVYSHFALFGWFPIWNIRHYSVGSEYSHYSVGFKFRIFAIIRSVENIRTIRLRSNFEYSPLFYGAPKRTIFAKLHIFVLN